jgi:hypothetical protein
VALDDTVTVVRFSQIVDSPSELSDRLRGIGGVQNKFSVLSCQVAASLALSWSECQVTLDNPSFVDRVAGVLALGVRECQIRPYPTGGCTT